MGNNSTIRKEYLKKLNIPKRTPKDVPYSGWMEISPAQM